MVPVLTIRSRSVRSVLLLRRVTTSSPTIIEVSSIRSRGPVGSSSSAAIRLSWASRLRRVTVSVLLAINATVSPRDVSRRFRTRLYGADGRADPALQLPTRIWKPAVKGSVGEPCTFHDPPP